MPKISVIIPVYNVEKYLNRAIDSVLNQQTDMEVIVVDDGSTDKSGALCDVYSGERVHVLHTENGGLSSARNKGLSLAEGEYVCFLDSDDYLDDGALEFMLNRAEETKADIVLCGFYIEKGDKKTPVCTDESLSYAYDMGECFARLKRTHLFDSACNKLYSRDFLNKNSLCFAEGEIFEDTDFNLRAFECNPLVAVSDRCFYHYVQRAGGSITKTFNQRKLPTLKKRAISLYDFCKDHCKPAVGFCGVYYFKSLLSALADTYMPSAGKIDRSAAIREELSSGTYDEFLKTAEGIGAEKLILFVAKTKNTALIKLCARLVYFIKYRR